jgi:hypothetical protein
VVAAQFPQLREFRHMRGQECQPPRLLVRVHDGRLSSRLG